MKRASRDQGDIVLGWLTRLAVVLSLFGLLAFDGIAIAVARLTAADHATTAAVAAADSFHSTSSVQSAYDAALGSVVADGDTIETASFQVSPDGAVRLTLHHAATTLLMDRIGYLRPYVDSRAEGKGRPGT